MKTLTNKNKGGLKSLTTIIFDLGGVVLSHTKPITPALLSHTFEVSDDLGLLAYKKYREHWRTGKMSSYQILSQLKNQLKNGKSVADLLQIYREAYLEISHIDEAMIELIKKLGTVYTTAVLSNTTDLHHHINKERGFLDHFHHAYMSYEIGYAKPDKLAFLHVLKELRAEPGEVLFIDDKKENIHSAEELGIQTHHFSGIGLFIDDITKRELI